MSEENEPKKMDPKSGQILLRYFLVVVVLGFVASGILFCAFRTAVLERQQWLDLAKTIQNPPKRLIYPSRGNIYSSEGKLMATSVPTYNLYIDFGAECFSTKTKKWSSLDTFLYSKRNGIDSLAYYLSHKLKDRTTAGYKAYLMSGLKAKRKNRQFPVYNKRVSYSDWKEIKDFPFFRLGMYRSGFYTREMVKRNKPFEKLASRTIGDTFGDIDPKTGLTQGKNGLELRYDSLLHGVPGLNSVRRVGGGWTNVVEVEPVEGLDIRTTIDINIQDITEKSLVDMLTEVDAASGTAVVMEVSTGEVKAITNMGRSSKGGYIEDTNHAVGDETEPGSTFKVASIMVALEDGVCLPSDTVDVGNGVYFYKRARMTDHNNHRGGYGKITVEQAIWYSSNIGVAKTILKGYEHDQMKFWKGLERIGLMEDLHLEIPGSGRAKIRRPDDELRPWSKVSLPWMSFGYETQIPPIYTLAFYNAIANNGKMMRPMFTKEIMRRGETVERFHPQVVRESICSEQTLAIVKDMLIGVVEKGTAKDVHSDFIRIAGKTGTAQIASGGVYRQAGHQVAFCGYFPADNPKYSCIAVIRQPRNGYPSGGRMAGGVVKSIAEKIYATHTVIDLDTMRRDSTAIMLPRVKGGDLRAVRNVLDELEISADADSIQGQWVLVSTDKDSNKVKMSDLTIQDGVVPRVIGLGAKDAVFLLEKAGVRASISGVGRVVSQSLAPGRRVSRGETVMLTLK